MSFEKKRKIIDCFLFYNEIDILEYRLSVLWDIIDFFIISESSLSFIGNPKPFFSDDSRFDKFRKKIISVKLESFPFLNPNLSKNEQWLNENYQRDCLKNGVEQLLKLGKICDDDVLIINDVDEIPDPLSLETISTNTNISINSLFVFRQKYHCYNLKTIRDIDWIHSKAFSIRTWKEKLMLENFSTIRLYGVTSPFNSMISPELILYGGWHLSYFGTVEFISNKLQNFSHQEFNVSLDDIKKRKEAGVDIMGRENITHSIIPLEKNPYLPPKAFFFFQEM